MNAAAWGAAALGLLPLVCLVALAAAGQQRESDWWWMAAAFVVSFLSDVAGAFGHWSIASQLYPATQVVLFAAVLLPRRMTEWIIVAVVSCASLSIAARSAAGLEALLHTIAWGAIAAFAWTGLLKSTLRSALSYGFGVSVLAWWWYAAVPGWPSWIGYQGSRALVVGWWSYAAWTAEG